MAGQKRRNWSDEETISIRLQTKAPGGGCFPGCASVCDERQPDIQLAE